MKSYGIFMLVPAALLLPSVLSLKTDVLAKACISDGECEDFEVCYRNKCASACNFRNGTEGIARCGVKAFCYVMKSHSVTCSCGPGFTGDAEIECFKIKNASADEVHKCEKQDDCQIFEACVAEKCIDVCRLQNGNVVVDKCGPNAYCYTSKPHVGACKCAPTHAGDPAQGCNERLSIVHSDPM